MADQHKVLFIVADFEEDGAYLELKRARGEHLFATKAEMEMEGLPFQTLEIADDTSCMVLDAGFYGRCVADNIWPDEKSGIPDVMFCDETVSLDAVMQKAKTVNTQAYFDFAHKLKAYAEPERVAREVMESALSYLPRMNIILDFDEAYQGNIAVGIMQAEIPQYQFDGRVSAFAVMDARMQYNFYDSRKISDEMREELAGRGAAFVPQGKAGSLHVTDPSVGMIKDAALGVFGKPRSMNIVHIHGNLDGAYVSVGERPDFSALNFPIDLETPRVARDKNTSFVFWGEDNRAMRAHYIAPEGVKVRDVDLSNPGECRIIISPDTQRVSELSDADRAEMETQARSLRGKPKDVIRETPLSDPDITSAPQPF